MTSINKTNENYMTPAAKKAWTTPYFEIIPRDKIKTGISDVHVEGSKGGTKASTTYCS